MDSAAMWPPFRGQRYNTIQYTSGFFISACMCLCSLSLHTTLHYTCRLRGNSQHDWIRWDHNTSWNLLTKWLLFFTPKSTAAKPSAHAWGELGLGLGLPLLQQTSCSDRGRSRAWQTTTFRARSGCMHALSPMHAMFLHRWVLRWGVGGDPTNPNSKGFTIGLGPGPTDNGHARSGTRPFPTPWPGEERTHPVNLAINC